MATAVDRHRQAERDARAFLGRTLVTTTVLEQRGEIWRCELHCARHPGGEDMTITVAQDASTRGNALDLAHAQLQAEVLRYYLDPAAGAAELNGDRETLRYEPGPLSARRVRAALAHRREGDVGLDACLQAGLHCSINSAGRATVGDVVAHMLDASEGKLLL